MIETINITRFLEYLEVTKKLQTDETPELKEWFDNYIKCYFQDIYNIYNYIKDYENLKNIKIYKVYQCLNMCIKENPDVSMNDAILFIEKNSRYLIEQEEIKQIITPYWVEG